MERFSGVALLFGLSLSLASAAIAAPSAGSTATPPASAAKVAAPFYVVVEGQHTEAATAFQSLTVLCPADHKAFGAGFSAVIRDAPKAGDKAPNFHEAGLDDVRSFPDANGGGWIIQGVSPDAVRLKQPWRLVERVVCVQVGH
jgi:hypothetical protein